MKDLKPGHVLIEVVSSAEGECLCIGDGDGGFRLAGPKPFGIGRTIYRFQVRIDELRSEIDAIERAAKEGRDAD